MEQKPTFYPYFLDGWLQLRDAVVEGLFLCCKDNVASSAVSAVAANAVPPSSSREKGRFNPCEDFIYLVVLNGLGPIELIKRPLDNIVSVHYGGCQIFEMGVEIVGQVFALG